MDRSLEAWPVRQLQFPAGGETGIRWRGGTVGWLQGAGPARGRLAGDC